MDLAVSMADLALSTRGMPNVCKMPLINEDRVESHLSILGYSLFQFGSVGTTRLSRIRSMIMRNPSPSAGIRSFDQSKTRSRMPQL
jgi:hypothetical protein